MYALRGGSFVDTADGSFNHKITAATRMGNTPDSGGCNTGFRCAKGDGGGHDGLFPEQSKRQRRRKPQIDQEKLQQIVAEQGARL